MEAIAEVKVKTPKIVGKDNIPVSDRTISKEFAESLKKEAKETELYGKNQSLDEMMADFRKIMEL